MLILTSNRAASIDPAFESRIDLTLSYDALTKDARKEVWRKFSKDSNVMTELTQEDIDELADSPLNGRQIKSAIKTAAIFAASLGSSLSRKHLEVVIGMRMKAMAWLQTENGQVRAKL